MPANRKDHIIYTRKEWTSESYFIKLLGVLKNAQICSYLDIGANVGEVSNVLFDHISSMKSAYLIEPQLENFNFLKGNVNSSGRQISFYQVGIFYGKKEGELYIDPSWPNPGSFALTDSRQNFKPVGEIVKLTTLEELNLPSVDFVKIDVEGSEYNIIENSEYLKQCTYLDIEFHSHNIPYVTFCEDHLSTHSIILNECGHLLLKKKI